MERKKAREQLPDKSWGGKASLRIVMFTEVIIIIIALQI